MAVVPMQKVAIVSYRPHAEETLNLLHKEGVMEITTVEGETELSDTAILRADTEFAINHLAQHASKATLAHAQQLGSTSEIEQSMESTEAYDLVERIKEIDAEQDEVHQLLLEEEQVQEQYAPWKYLPYTEEASTETTQRVLGTLPKENVDAVKHALQEELPRSALTVLPGTDAKLAYCVFYVWKDDRRAAEILLTQFGWTTVELAVGTQSVEQLLTESMQKTQEMKQRQEILIKELVSNSKKLRLLKQYHQALLWTEDKNEAKKAIVGSRDTITLFGWMPREEVKTIEVKLKQLSSATAVFKIKADEDEETPVFIRNSKLFTPFESVTKLYGLPLYTESDPTRALAPFFILYFALCLTDAGYGLMLAIIFGTAIFLKKLAVRDQPLVWLLFLSGIITFFVGILFGGWFGFAPSQAPDFLTYTTPEGERLFLGQIWNLSTQSGVQFLQYLSIALGITHLSYGMFLAGVHKWVHGQKAAALWMDMTNHVLIGAGIFALVAPESMETTASWILYAALALFIWGKGYGSKWYIRPIVGIIGLLNFGIGLLSNTLSYLRLLALGLVTGAIAFAINQVAMQIGMLFPIYIAIPVIIVIFILGHTVSIALNTLGAFIHSGRLQFIEFFSQFFEGGGRDFTPFSRTTTS